MAELASSFHEMALAHPWLIYACVFLAPFIQEDAAVIGAAGLSINAMGAPGLLLLAAIVGLSSSDLWKYWLGRAARTQAWAAKFAKGPRIQRAEKALSERLGSSLLTVRFIPGARIALYIAAGYFGVSWPRFAVWILATAALYVGLVFGLFHWLGAVAGEAARAYVPLVALALVGVIVVIQLSRRGKAIMTEPENGQGAPL
ncbi:MAG: VTT domain-containing protein [Pseudomonadota bacterium]